MCSRARVRGAVGGTGQRRGTGPDAGALRGRHVGIVRRDDRRADRAVGRRIAYYIGIEKGELPSSVYYGPWRTFPDTCEFSFQETLPAGFTRTYGGRRQNHPHTVDAQIDHGMNVAGYGTWGFSPSNDPAGGYRAYGVDAIGMDPNGNPSNNDRTLVDRGFDHPDCFRPPTPDPPQRWCRAPTCRSTRG
jgi:hypothetical protein